MHTNVYCQDIFDQIKPLFHTLKWSHISRCNQIKFYRKHFELEMFEIRIYGDKIHMTIPLIGADVGYNKIFNIKDIYYAIKFLHFHINNYIQNVDAGHYPIHTYNHLYLCSSLQLIPTTC
uniref:Uncharacterized protein n=1 Tax=viral metagenome TaxID=1070528 RepID=A0A6C0LUX0_9ZZZZ